MRWLVHGLGLSAAVLVALGLLLRVVEAILTGRRPLATLASMLAGGVLLVALAIQRMMNS